MPLVSAVLEGLFPKPQAIMSHRMMGSKKHKRCVYWCPEATKIYENDPLLIYCTDHICL